MIDRADRAAPVSPPPAEHGDRERKIARLLAPGLRANAWRRDYEAFQERRLWAENYQARRIRILRRAMPDLARTTILDLGCGRGGLAVALRREGYRVVALDLRRSCCEVTLLRGERYALTLSAVQACGERLPFGGESFGAILCSDVLEHSERPAALLGEIWRVLRRGGSCFITVINRFCWVDPHYHLPGLSFLPRALAERCIRLLGRGKASGQDRQQLSDLHYYSYAEFVRWAESFGFGVRDLLAERLHRYRSHGLVNGARWLHYQALRPFSLHGYHFEFLLAKPVRKVRT